MISFLLRRALPLLVFGSLSLASCTVHNHDSGYRDHRHDRGRWHDRDHRDYGYQRGRW